MTRDGNPLHAVAMALAATFLFAAADTLGKHLALLYAVTLVLAMRYAVNLALVSLVMAPRHGRALWQTRRTGLVLLRGLCLALASICMLAALRVMPVAETVAIIYITPVLVMLVSGRVLGETVGTFGWIGAGLGFAGVLLVARPGSGLDPTGVALSLLNAALATGYHILTRVLTRTETTMAMMFHTALVGTVVFVGLTLILRSETLPTPGDAALMLALGALATVGHLLFTTAYRAVSPSILAPVNYMHIGFATALGWLVFRQIPDALAFVGMGFIAAAGLLAALRAVGRTPADNEDRQPAARH
jgi:drug/metabolite transporter (DMT)-like permease